MAISNSTDRFNGYVASLGMKAPCVVDSTVNLTLSGVQTVNSIAVVDGDRVLVNGQTDDTENGIWVVRSGAWERAPDFDGNRDVTTATLVMAGRNGLPPAMWWVSEALPITIGTSSINFTVYTYGSESAAATPTLQEVTTAGNETTDNILISNGSIVIASSTPAETGTIDKVGDDFRITSTGTIGLIPDTGGVVYIGSDGVGSAGTLELRGNGYTSQFGAGLNDFEWVFPGVTVEQTRDLVIGNNLARNIRLEAPLALLEISASYADVATYGQVWVRDDVPNVLMFTDDAGSDQLIDPSISEIVAVTASRPLVLSDKGKTVSFSGATAAQTMTIPANASIPYPLGTFLGFDNSGSVDISIAITSDTLTWADDNTTGTRTLAAGGYAVAQKISATGWKIAGKQLT